VEKIKEGESDFNTRSWSGRRCGGDLSEIQGTGQITVLHEIVRER
jgi:hypothetical protein